MGSRRSSRLICDATKKMCCRNEILSASRLKFTSYCMRYVKDNIARVLAIIYVRKVCQYYANRG
jgi:hypothetical protein